MLTSLLDPESLRNLKSINPILRNSKEARLKTKLLQSCLLRIAISQDWVDGFPISQSPGVREALGHILKLCRFHKNLQNTPIFSVSYYRDCREEIA